MNSRKPYLIRAIYDWIVDNHCTPYLLVDCAQPDVQVPDEHVQDGKIILNIGPTAVHGLSLDNSGIFFSARFSGRSREIHVPPVAVLALYARENGEGIMFPPEEGDGEPPPDDGGHDGSGSSGGSKPHLKVVK